MSEQLSAHEEHDLIQAMKSRPDAFRKLYRHYFPRVFSYVAYRVGRRQDAEDITADVFMIVIKKFEQFDYRGEGSFSAWIFRIAYNQVQQFWRNHKSPTTIPLDDLPEISQSYISFDSQLMSKERFKRLHAMINTLSSRRKEVVTLKFFGGLRNQEIAEILGLDERTVASHLSRALDDLKHKYEGEKIYE